MGSRWCCLMVLAVALAAPVEAQATPRSDSFYSISPSFKGMGKPLLAAGVTTLTAGNLAVTGASIHYIASPHPHQIGLAGTAWALGAVSLGLGIWGVADAEKDYLKGASIALVSSAGLNIILGTVVALRSPKERRKQTWALTTMADSTGQLAAGAAMVGIF